MLHGWGARGVGCDLRGPWPVTCPEGEEKAREALGRKGLVGRAPCGRRYGASLAPSAGALEVEVINDMMPLLLDLGKGTRIAS